MGWSIRGGARTKFIKTQKMGQCARLQEVFKKKKEDAKRKRLMLSGN